MNKLSIHRIGELLDYATDYGALHEDMPNGFYPSNSVQFEIEMNDIRRDMIRAYKELMIVNGYDPETRYSQE